MLLINQLQSDLSSQEIRKQLCFYLQFEICWQQIGGRSVVFGWTVRQDLQLSFRRIEGWICMNFFSGGDLKHGPLCQLGMSRRCIIRRCGKRCHHAAIHLNNMQFFIGLIYTYTHWSGESICERHIWRRKTAWRILKMTLLITWRERRDQINHPRKCCCLTLLMGLNHTLWLRLANDHNTTLCCHLTKKQTRSLRRYRDRDYSCCADVCVISLWESFHVTKSFIVSMLYVYKSLNIGLFNVWFIYIGVDKNL